MQRKDKVLSLRPKLLDLSKNFLYCLTISVFSVATVNGQITENFNDGNFSDKPVWTGYTSSFIVNDQLQLQSNNVAPNSTFYLMTKSERCRSTEWEFWMQLHFNPSSANFVDTYLTCSSTNPNDANATGYFVRAGNTEDEISLYRKDSNDVITKIIDGQNGTVNHSNNIFKIKVTCDSIGNWQLFSDFSGTGDSYRLEGGTFDSTYKNSSWFGFNIKQSTSSFFQKHFIDDIEIKEFVADKTPPKVVSVTALSSNEVEIEFDEPIDPSSNIFSNYSADNNLGMPDSVWIDPAKPAIVRLRFENAFVNGYGYTLLINKIKDLAGNILENGTATFIFYQPQRYDVIIDEIMADPVPVVGLPETEWIELKNISSFPIELKGWQLSDASGHPSVFDKYKLQPDSFLIVCAPSDVSSLSSFGKVIGLTGFPSLNNDGDEIILRNDNGKVIHAVQYSSDWYGDESKSDGGWSLEMIDTKYPCRGISNWAVSNDERGGTPGRNNSVDGINNNDASPKILRAYAENPSSVTIVFNESVDSTVAADFHNYSFSDNLDAVDAMPISALFDRVTVTLNYPISAEKIYTVSTTHISDCAGNQISTTQSVRFGLTEEADSFDIVINEILFNPFPEGVDYIELYNRSEKIIDLGKLLIANRNGNNEISSIKQLSSEPNLLFPKDYIVLTTDPSIVKSQYITLQPDAFLKIQSLPSFPDDKGFVVLLNDQQKIVDEVDYSDKWHFSLIHNTEGVSLERIAYDSPSEKSNFQSAASSAGFGTPGYKNSQSKATSNFRASITVTPEIFSPDNDGFHDFATINYKFPTPGFVANITIFDASGRKVRYLEKSALCGTSGYFKWDGLDEKKQKLPQGIYVIYTEIFNSKGDVRKFKNTVVLARKNY
ncbi:MAG: lamin tail domain-containing protein [Ginsengibacter sp.]